MIVRITKLFIKIHVLIKVILALINLATKIMIYCKINDNYFVGQN